MDRDPAFAQMEVERSLRNILHFFKYHAWTHDPRPGVLSMYGLKKPTLPFLLYPFQERESLRVFNNINKGRDVLIEKSRDMGVSWFVVLIILFCWLQKQGGNDFLLGSRKYEFVDKKGAQDSLFQKFRYDLYQIHPAFLPQGFKSNNNDNIGMLTNPETGSFIRGESNNANFGTSGRYKAILLDEFGKWLETAEQAWTSCGDSSPCRIPVSTPFGFGGKFAQLRHSGAIDVVTLHWHLHPIKGAGKYKGNHPVLTEKTNVWLSPWYLAECERRKDDGKANIAQELDIDYLSSGFPYFNNTDMSHRYRTLVDNQPQIKRYMFEISGTGLKKKVELVEDANGPLYIVDEPQRLKHWKYRYLIAADVAEGLEKGDYSYFVVYDRVDKRDVGWYHGHCDTDTLAALLAFYGKRYDDAWIAPEKNNEHGGAVIATLKRIYKKIMHEREFDRAIDITRTPVRLGWATTPLTRGILCGELRAILKDHEDGILDAEFFNEALVFVYNKNGKPEASEGSFDDRVMTQGIKFQLHKWLPAPKRVRGRKPGGKADYNEGDDWRTKVKRYEGADYV
jgi:hypothetical protein